MSYDDERVKGTGLWSSSKHSHDERADDRRTNAFGCVPASLDDDLRIRCMRGEAKRVLMVWSVVGQMW
jgi:hypothetical protein